MADEDLMGNALKLAMKDLVIEARRAHEFMSILAFALSSILISSFAWRGVLVLGPEVISATLWIVVYFSSILTLTTSFAREVDRGTIEGLRSLPCSSFAILLGKVLYGAVIMFTVMVATVLSATLFLNIELSVVPSLFVVFVMGVIDLALIGSVISAIVIPVSVPILIPGTQAVGKVISGEGLLSVMPELRLLLAFLLAIVAVSMLLFRHVFLE
ncbi:hypothetical protein GH157_03040 [archaeon]|nr:hypothetical protein [archaeon]